MDGIGLAALVGVGALMVWEHRAVFVLAEPPPRTRPRPTSAWRCPYCHEELAGSGTRRRCSHCGTVQHTACWDQHGGCSVHGCAGRSTRARPSTEAETDAVDAEREGARTRPSSEAEAESETEAGIAEPATPIGSGPSAA